MRLIRAYAGGILLVLCCTTPLEAQFDGGQISGFVRDAAGLVVPGVSVTAILLFVTCLALAFDRPLSFSGRAAFSRR